MSKPQYSDPAARFRGDLGALARECVNFVPAKSSLTQAGIHPYRHWMVEVYS